MPANRSKCSIHTQKSRANTSHMKNIVKQALRVHRGLGEAMTTIVRILYKNKLQKQMLKSICNLLAELFVVVSTCLYGFYGRFLLAVMKRSL